jgi:hypothetical protein
MRPAGILAEEANGRHTRRRFRWHVPGVLRGSGWLVTSFRLSDYVDIGTRAVLLTTVLARVGGAGIHHSCLRVCPTRPRDDFNVRRLSHRRPGRLPFVVNVAGTYVMTLTQVAQSCSAKVPTWWRCQR